MKECSEFIRCFFEENEDYTEMKYVRIYKHEHYSININRLAMKLKNISYSGNIFLK